VKQAWKEDAQFRRFVIATIGCQVQTKANTACRQDSVIFAETLRNQRKSLSTIVPPHKRREDILVVNSVPDSESKLT
jgi:hypothetical protein